MPETAQGLPSSLPTIAMLTVLSVVPAVLLMTTCFVRIVVVFGLLRQALGLSQLPPTQVITALALFMTLAVMRPVWNGKEFAPRLMLPLSLSYDHRVIDGAEGARFTTVLAETLSNPYSLIEAVP